MFSNGNTTETFADDGKIDLLEVMHVFSDIYLTHLLAEEILGESRHFAELGESSWITAILPHEGNIFLKRLMQIH